MALSTSINGYWKLDSNSNDSVASNNGTDANITYSTGNGKLVQGAGFNGTSSKITFGSTFSGTGDFSIGMWIKTTTTTDSPLWTKRATLTGNGICKLGILTDGKIYFWDYNGSAFQFPAGVTATKAVNDGNWHHIVFTRNGTAGKYYVDGLASGTTTAASNLSWNTDIATVGYGGAGSPTEWFNGALDEIGIWNKELTGDEVSQLYNSGRGNAYPLTDSPSLYGAVAYYKLDESSGNASDATGSGYTLTNNGTTAYSTGKINNGAVFDNTAGKNLDYNGNLSFAGGGTRTFSCWVNCSSFAVDGYVLDNTTTTAGSGSANRRFILYTGSDSKIHMFASGNEVTTSTLSTGTWYHCVVTQNGTTWELFLNGTSQGTTTMSTASYADDSFRIGESYAGGGYGRSTVDEVGVWLRVLSGTEITQLYNSGSGLAYPFTTAVFVPKIAIY